MHHVVLFYGLGLLFRLLFIAASVYLSNFATCI